MKEMQKIKAKNQVANALNKRNRPSLMVFVVHDLSLDFDILIWKESNTRHNGKWTGLYKFLAVENKICTLQFPISSQISESLQSNLTYKNPLVQIF